MSSRVWGSMRRCRRWTMEQGFLCMLVLAWGKGRVTQGLRGVVVGISIGKAAGRAWRWDGEGSLLGKDVLVRRESQLGWSWAWRNPVPTHPPA